MHLDLHPEYGNTRFTLRGLFLEQTLANDKADELVAEGLKVYVFEEDAPGGMTVFGVAARHEVTPVGRAGIPHDHSADWQITRAAIDLFRRIMKAAGGERGRRWYKPLDVELLHRCIRSLHWSGSHVEMAARIVSDLVLAHPFPNANHRSSIHLARSYLQACGIAWPSFDLRGHGAMRLHRETKPFFVESKYLLQIHRHPPLLKTAWDAGYRILRIGPDAQAEIREADLGLRRDNLYARHSAAARRMFEHLGGELSEEGLHTPRTKGLREWADTIRRR